jgi:hypothetical protein
MVTLLDTARLEQGRKLLARLSPEAQNLVLNIAVNGQMTRDEILIWCFNRNVTNVDASEIETATGLLTHPAGNNLTWIPNPVFAAAIFEAVRDREQPTPRH